MASRSLSPRFDILSSPFFRKCMEGKFREATFGPNFERFLGSSQVQREQYSAINVHDNNDNIMMIYHI